MSERVEYNPVYWCYNCHSRVDASRTVRRNRFNTFRVGVSIFVHVGCPRESEVPNRTEVVPRTHCRQDPSPTGTCAATSPHEACGCECYGCQPWNRPDWPPGSVPDNNETENEEGKQKSRPRNCLHSAQDWYVKSATELGCKECDKAP